MQLRLAWLPSVGLCLPCALRGTTLWPPTQSMVSAGQASTTHTCRQSVVEGSEAGSMLCLDPSLWLQLTEVVVCRASVCLCASCGKQ
jgi:hypothetical protein